MMVAVVVLAFLTLMGILYFGIDFSTIFTGVLFVLGLYLIIKAVIEKRSEFKKHKANALKKGF
jgi:hypothetical protein